MATYVIVALSGRCAEGLEAPDVQDVMVDEQDERAERLAHRTGQR